MTDCETLKMRHSLKAELSNEGQDGNASCGCASDETACKTTDYANRENWLINDYANVEKADTTADVILFSGTGALKRDYDNGVANISDDMRTCFQQLYDSSTYVFDDGTRIYIPLYRQIAADVALECTAHNDLIDKMRSTVVKDDIFAVLDYYFENYNEGRPFIIGGQSQGGAAVQIALEDYFGQKKNRSYLEQMVAAYSIAYGVDKNWLEKFDYLKFATGSDDTGVVISWNTEGVGEKGKNILLADNPADTLVINPINWKTDSTYAKAEECPASLVNGTIVSPGVYNLQIDLERGSVICDNCTQYTVIETSSGPLWGGKSLHGVEQSLAFGSIRQNMHERIDAFVQN